MKKPVRFIFKEFFILFVVLITLSLLSSIFLQENEISTYFGFFFKSNQMIYVDSGIDVGYICDVIELEKNFDNEYVKSLSYKNTEIPYVRELTDLDIDRLWKISKLKKNESINIKTRAKFTTARLVTLTIFVAPDFEGVDKLEVTYVFKPENSSIFENDNFVIASKKLKPYSQSYKPHRYRLNENELAKVKAILSNRNEKLLKFEAVRFLYKYKPYYLLYFLSGSLDHIGKNIVLNNEFKTINENIVIRKNQLSHKIGTNILFAGGTPRILPYISFDFNEDGISEFYGEYLGWEEFYYGFFWFELQNGLDRMFYQSFY